jgi:outer membrane protein assembly factor BamD (BamD/ComL family)
MKFVLCTTLCSFIIFLNQPLHAAYTIKDGRLIQTHELATKSVQEHYSMALSAYEKQQWEDLVLQSNIVIKNFPDSPFSPEAQFYLAVGFYHLGELELANKQISLYLKKYSSPKFFEEAITYKYKIAEKFQFGAKKHLLGLESMPKWMPASEEALQIYDEVITAMPHHELAVQSMFGKATILLADDDFSSSVETFHALIRKFGKHPLACESYIGIAKVYLSQCKKEFPDPDFLDLAELNFKKFKADFPNEPRVAVAEGMLKKMKEIYADDLYQTAQFFERTNKPRAASIYYNKILAKYPKTQVAHNSGARLAFMEKKFDQVFRDDRLFLAHIESVKSEELADQSIADVAQDLSSEASSVEHQPDHGLSGAVSSDGG